MFETGTWVFFSVYLVVTTIVHWKMPEGEGRKNALKMLRTAFWVVVGLYFFITATSWVLTQMIVNALG